MIRVEENFDFTSHQDKMNLVLPEKSNIAILPQNIFTTDASPFYNEEVKTIKKYFQKENLDNIYCSSTNGSIEFKAQKSSELILPSILISSYIFSQNQELISISLNIISNYVYDMFKGIPKKKQRVKMDIICESDDNGNFSKVSFEGDPESLKELSTIIREMKKK